MFEGRFKILHTRIASNYQFRRLLISQDSYEIFLTIAEFDSAYEKYLHGDEKATPDEPSLMKMKPYRPWSTKNYTAHGASGDPNASLSHYSNSQPIRLNKTPLTESTKPRGVGKIRIA